MAEATTLEESVKAAVEAEKPAAETTDTTEKQETKTDANEEEGTQGKEKEVTDNKPTLTEVEQQQALQLFAALKDPNHSRTVIEGLAKLAGLELGGEKPATKAEVAEVKKGIVEVLKERLGPDLDYLAEKLGPVIEQVVKSGIDEGTADLRARQAENETQKLTSEADQAMSKLAKDHFNKESLPDDVVEEMNRVMDQISLKPGMSVAEYIDFAYYFVAGKKGIKAVDASQEDRRAKNRTDAPSRLASEGRREPVAQESTTYTTLHAAVEAAIKEQAAKEK